MFHRLTYIGLIMYGGYLSLLFVPQKFENHLYSTHIEDTKKDTETTVSISRLFFSSLVFVRKRLSASTPGRIKEIYK